MVMKAHEDKENPGAFIASMSIPWGPQVSANDGKAGGYHLVWARDEFQTASTLLAMGDRAAASRALDYLFNKQQRPDGSFPQNTWLDGRPYFGSLQMDEVAYPLLLALLLHRTDADTYQKHLKPAAEFLTQHGPYSPQERWEESAGYSPSTMAAEIAGLVSVGLAAEQNGDADTAGACFKTADTWAAKVADWTATRAGPYPEKQYYLRISDNLTPNDGHAIHINNGGGEHDKREIVDMGCLELVRLGVQSPHDELIQRTMQVVDRMLRRNTLLGPGWYRYNHDGYGEKADGRAFDGTGVGRLWPLLTGERGEYALARGEDASPYLNAMQRMANPGRMISEQVWDQDNTLYDPLITLGDVARTLRQHFGEVCNADGNADGFISRSDLTTVLDQPERPLEIRQAAQFLVDHPSLLQMLDVAAGQGVPDDRIGEADLDAAVHWYEGEAPRTSAGRHTPAGSGHGTGSAAPLVWAMAEFNRLALGQATGHLAGVPSAIAAHFAHSAHRPGSGDQQHEPEQAR
ncbi:MAG: glycoside hydrolase family 15 protein [Candidatus Xenobia bacterium]